MKHFKRESGFTFMEILIALSLMTVAFVSIMPLYYSLGNYVLSNREKSESNSIATREMEKIRNSTYENVGIAGGNPTGIFVADRDEAQADGKVFHIATRIWWVDDPMDGTAVLGTDATPSDYKMARVTVTRSGSTKVLAQLTSNIARASEEQPITGGNMLVKVFLADGTTPLEDVRVNITNGPSSPMQGWTDETGMTLFPELTPSITAGDYSVSVSKAGYVARSDQIILTTTIIFGQTRTLTFIMDLPGHLTVRLKDPSGNVIDKVSQLVVSNIVTGDITYDGQTGYFDFPDFIPGDYQITASATSYLPTTEITTVTVVRNETAVVDITLQPKVYGYLALSTFDFETSAILPNAVVKLTSQDNGSVFNTTTNASGVATVDLEPGTYTVDITAPYHQPFTEMAVITSGATTTMVASLLGYPQTGWIRVRTERTSHQARSNISIRVTGPSGYDQSGATNSNGEITFPDLVPGTYRIYRWGSEGWMYRQTKTVTAGNETYYCYTW